MVDAIMFSSHQKKRSVKLDNAWKEGRQISSLMRGNWVWTPKDPPWPISIKVTQMRSFFCVFMRQKNEWHGKTPLSVDEG